MSHSAEEITIMLEFPDPADVSATSNGRDQLIIDVKDMKIFKSKLTGEVMSLESFEGRPQLSFSLPPITTDVG